jgi:hypothetical protein
MAADQLKDPAGLKSLLSEGYLLIEQYNLYGIWDNIPKSGEPAYTPQSMDQYLKQNIMPGVFKSWQTKVDDYFTRSSLNYLKLKHRVNGQDSRKQSPYPVAVFLRTMRELEAINEDDKLATSYLTNNESYSSYPEITYADGVIKQGSREHRFNYDHYQKLFDLLWDRRKVCNLQGEITKEYLPTSREEIFKIRGLGDIGRLKDTATGVRKSMKQKKISLKLKYPDDVFIEVIQK